MTNRFGVFLHPEDVRWAAAEGVSETVIAAVLLLHDHSIDEIVPELSAIELEQVIQLVGRSPRLYAPGTLEALKQRRSSLAPARPTASLPLNATAEERTATSSSSADSSRGRKRRLPQAQQSNPELSRRANPSPRALETGTKPANTLSERQARVLRSADLLSKQSAVIGPKPGTVINLRTCTS